MTRLWIWVTALGSMLLAWGFRKMGLRFIGYRIVRGGSGSLVIAELVRQPGAADRAVAGRWN